MLIVSLHVFLCCFMTISDRFSMLPDEIVTDILALCVRGTNNDKECCALIDCYSDTSSALVLALTCKRFHDIVLNPALNEQWQKIARNKWEFVNHVV